MDIDQAIKIIKQVCASVEANLTTHNKIQQAIQVVEKVVAGEKEPEEPA